MSAIGTAARRDEFASRPDRDELRRAILGTLIYADLFDYPLTATEIGRYLIGVAAPAALVQELLDGDPTLRRRVAHTDLWFHLVGRGHLADVRRRRAEASARLWPVARRYTAAIARLPLVRLVAVTGALAMDNADPGSDIDLFILAQPRRLWLCRLLVLGVVRFAALRGHRLCPNFLLSTDALALWERNLFTAHELAQMVPVAPLHWYDAFVEANRWARDYLPNFSDGRTTGLLAPAPAQRHPVSQVLVSQVLGLRTFDWLEGWEMRRKIRRLEARARADGGSVAFSSNECRGHFGAHDVRVLAAFAGREAELAEAVL